MATESLGSIDAETHDRRRQLMVQLLTVVSTLDVEADSVRGAKIDLASCLILAGVTMANGALGPAAVAEYLADLTERWTARSPAATLDSVGGVGH